MRAIDDDDWMMIESLMQDVTLENNNFLSQSYIKDANDSLVRNCDSNETIQELIRMAK